MQNLGLGLGVWKRPLDRTVWPWYMKVRDKQSGKHSTFLDLSLCSHSNMVSITVVKNYFHQVSPFQEVILFLESVCLTVPEQITYLIELVL